MVTQRAEALLSMRKKSRKKKGRVFSIRAGRCHKYENYPKSRMARALRAVSAAAGVNVRTG